MKNFIKILFLIVALNSYGQSNYNDSRISKETRKIVKKIIKINELMSEAVYASGIRPEQYDNFEKLEKRATQSELIELCNHPNGVVKGYAFWALSNDGTLDLFPIVNNHINDEQLVTTQFGCIMGQEMVGDIFIDVIMSKFHDREYEEKNWKKLEELDSILIYKPNRLRARYGAINRSEPTEILYPKLRQLVVEQNNQTALVKLAKYQKQQDIEIILNNRDETDKVERGYYYTYLAISEFPRPEFVPFLEEQLINTLDNTHYSTEWRELYRSIASYQNEKSLELLKIPFTDVEHKNIKKYHIRFLQNAIGEFKDPIFNELYWKIWEDEGYVSVDILKYLLKENPSKAFELSKYKMDKTYSPKNSNFTPNLQNVKFTENIYESLLSLIMNNDDKFAESIIIKQIAEADVHSLPLYTSRVNNNSVYIEPLFQRLEDAWNAHIYLNLIETLILFKDEKVNNRILEMRNVNENLNEGWGGKDLDKLLTKNNIK